MGGQYKEDYTVMYAIEKLFYKKLSFVVGNEVLTASPDGKLVVESIYTSRFHSRVAEKLGRQKFAQAKKEAAEWKRIVKEAGVSSRVPADKKKMKSP